jgi:hypothetical protein
LFYYTCLCAFQGSDPIRITKKEDPSHSVKDPCLAVYTM